MKTNQIFYPPALNPRSKYTGPERDLVPFNLERFRAGEYAINSATHKILKFVCIVEGAHRPMVALCITDNSLHNYLTDGMGKVSKLMMYDPIVYDRDNGLHLRLSQIPAGWRMLTEEERVAVCSWYGAEYRAHLKFADKENRFYGSFEPNYCDLELQTFYITDLKPGEIKTHAPVLEAPETCPPVSVQPELTEANELLTRCKQFLRELSNQRRADNGELTVTAQRIRESFTVEELK